MHWLIKTNTLIIKYHKWELKLCIILRWFINKIKY